MSTYSNSAAMYGINFHLPMIKDEDVSHYVSNCSSVVFPRQRFCLGLQDWYFIISTALFKKALTLNCDSFWTVQFGWTDILAGNWIKHISVFHQATEARFLCWWFTLAWMYRKYSFPIYSCITKFINKLILRALTAELGRKYKFV